MDAKSEPRGHQHDKFDIKLRKIMVKSANGVKIFRDGLHCVDLLKFRDWIGEKSSTTIFNIEEKFRHHSFQFPTLKFGI